MGNEPVDATVVEAAHLEPIPPEVPTHARASASAWAERDPGEAGDRLADEGGTARTTRDDAHWHSLISEYGRTDAAEPGIEAAEGDAVPNTAAPEPAEPRPAGPMMVSGLWGIGLLAVGAKAVSLFATYEGPYRAAHWWALLIVAGFLALALTITLRYLLDLVVAVRTGVRRRLTGPVFVLASVACFVLTWRRL